MSCSRQATLGLVGPESCPLSPPGCCRPLHTTPQGKRAMQTELGASESQGKTWPQGPAGRPWDALQTWHLAFEILSVYTLRFLSESSLSRVWCDFRDKTAQTHSEEVTPQQVRKVASEENLESARQKLRPRASVWGSPAACQPHCLHGHLSPRSPCPTPRISHPGVILHHPRPHSQDQDTRRVPAGILFIRTVSYLTWALIRLLMPRVSARPLTADTAAARRHLGPEAQPHLGGRVAGRTRGGLGVAPRSPPRRAAWAPSPTCQEGKTERGSGQPCGGVSGPREGALLLGRASPAAPHSPSLGSTPYSRCLSLPTLPKVGGGETQGAQGTGPPSPLSRKSFP